MLIGIRTLFLVGRLIYNAVMKIRYYHVAKIRWWGLASISCGFWVYIGMKDKDIPRTLMELMYFVLALRAVFNWLQ
jgi:hypothetical protein